MDLVALPGVVARGHRVASGAAGDPRFPRGTILPQLPFFRAALPDWDAYLAAPAFPGTINVKVNGTVETVAPEIFVPAVRWTTHFPPENFYLSRGGIMHGGSRYPAFLYIPDPVTKPDHVQGARIIELLAAHVPGLTYGAPVSILFQSGAIRLIT